MLPFFTLVLLAIGLFSSCDDQSDSGNVLSITSVVKAHEGDLTPVSQGDPNNYYIIRGTGLSGVRNIYFNDFDTYFNPVFVTDTEIFVLINEKTPYVNSSNKLKIVTSTGSVTYDFLIAPPVPTILGFNPINASADSEVTITGNYFINPIVKIAATATQPAIDVPIVSYSINKIVIKIPKNVNQRYISVANISGIATTNVAIGTALYDDVFYTVDGVGGWGISNTDITNSVISDVAQGEKAIKVDITSWSGFQIDMWGNGGVKVPAEATGIRFQMKNKTAARMRVIVGGDWGHEVWFNIKTEYDTYTIRWSDLGMTSAPATIGQLVFGSDGEANTFYIDNIGFSIK
ncbi:MAG: IPT/TIG domain-containing protein [Flavobacterium sp.]